MGEKLAKYFDYTKQEGGYPARLRLCLALELPTAKVEEAADSPELVHKCREAVEKILGRSIPML